MGFAGASFVDNLWFASHSLGGALQMATEFADELLRSWHLLIKDGSREALLVQGCAELATLEHIAAAWPQWSFVQELGCLGMRISWNGSVRGDLASWKRALLMAVARNTNGLLRVTTDELQKARHIQSFALPLLSYRGARWPCTASVGKFLDAVQRRVVISAHDWPRLPDESLDTWQARRRRAAGAFARRHGLWSQRQRQLAHAWHEHLLREQNLNSMASIALRYHGADWRRQQRLRSGSQDPEAGRLGTRVLTHVNARWEDALRRE